MSTVVSHQPPEMLTRREAAAYLGLQPITLSAWASTGRENLPYLRMGRSIRYRRSDLEKWLIAHTVHPGNK